MTAVRSAIISDLHLGAASRTDLLRRKSARDRLLARLASADRIVLLGDVVELRDRPLGDALQVARPFFEQLREVAPDAELVIVPGNHDYQLLEPWLRKQRLRSVGPSVALEQRIAATGDAVGKIAGWAGRERTSLAYPGLWLRDDVYATHGHYLDLHLTTPTFERLGLGALQRMTRAAPDGPSSPAEYERAVAPLYALLFALAQRPAPGPASESTTPSSMRAWHALGGATGRARTLRGRVLRSTVLPGAIKVASRLGLGNLRADLSLEQISRAGAVAMADVVASLKIDAKHVLFGHTHRRGPVASDLPDALTSDWRVGPTRLHNCGSWTYTPALIGSNRQTSPYWPGTLIEVDDSGRPASHQLLAELSEAEIREMARERCTDATT